MDFEDIGFAGDPLPHLSAVASSTLLAAVEDSFFSS